MSLPPIAIFILDVLGISLALLDFTGASRRIEKSLAKYREYQHENLMEAQADRVELLDFRRSGYLSGQIKKGWKEFIMFPVMNLIVVYLILKMTGYWPNLSAWGVWLIALTSPFWLFAVFIAHRFSGVFMSVTVSWIIHRIFWVLSRPKTGVIGTLGLALTIFNGGSNTLGFMG